MRLAVRCITSAPRIRAARKYPFAIGMVLLLLTGHPVRGQAQRSTAQVAADSLFGLQKWREAAAAYTALTATEPENGLAWMNLGESRLQLRQFDEAIPAFAKAESLKFRPYMNVVNQARAYAAKADVVRTLALMQRVIDAGAGGSLRPYILGSTEFNRLANDARWTALLAKARPCTAAPYRQFDFWVGDWDVHVGGKLSGRNLVTLEQDGCLIVEHWTASTGGQTGSSFNYYDVRDKQWHQLYLDNSGNAGAYPAIGGTFVDNKMVLLSADTNNTLSRWTWYVIEPGKVKQMAERSNDHGKTWQITWNSVYTKRAEKK